MSAGSSRSAGTLDAGGSKRIRAGFDGRELFSSRCESFSRIAPSSPTSVLLRTDLEALLLYKKNVGLVERWLRVIAGGAMIVCGFVLFGGAPGAWILAASGVFTIATGAVGFCPACAMVGRREVNAGAK